MTPKERAKQATEYLFTNSAGEKAVRLALIGPDGQDLGGWGVDAVAGAIERQIEEAIVQTFVISDADLRQIMPNLPETKRQTYRPHLVKAMINCEISTPLRATAFLAQIAHESAELRFMQELWGPTAQQKKYEPPSDVATSLGNTQPGDGFRYRGRGPIQITGRANYKKYGDLLGVDLVGTPDLAAQPEYAFQTAGLFWKTRGLNELADQGNEESFKSITKRINGGLNGLPERQKYYETAKKALGLASQQI
jgi:putative chitinase